MLVIFSNFVEKSIKAFQEIKGKLKALKEEVKGIVNKEIRIWERIRT